MVDLTRFHEGIEAVRNAAPEITRDPMGDAINVLVAEGAKVSGTLIKDKLTRVKGARCKGQDKDFWYHYTEIDDTQEDGHIIGILNYGYWKDGTSLNWCSRSENKMSNAERSAFIARHQAMQIAREQEELARQAEAAEKAYYIWNSTSPANDEHPYLVRKGVKASEGMRIGRNGNLIIPAAVDGKITTLQFIDDDGNKKFLSGGRKKSSWFVITGEGDTVYIAEGYSTGRSVHEATGCTVYIAWDSGNLYDVCNYVKKMHENQIKIIAADDDFKNKKNTGRQKAEQASEALNIKVVFPNGVNDFNDMHREQGLSALKRYLKGAKKKEKDSEEEIKDSSEDKKESIPPLIRPSGVLGEMYDYYNATSGNDQKGFAVHTSISICGTILGRSYVTDNENYTNMFFINVGKSGTGKEHAKKMVERILSACRLDHYISGDGYTSAGAVLSTLISKPNHISCIDEFGRYLEAAKGGKGNLHQREATTKIMESFGRISDTMRPNNYSTMTLKKDDAKLMESKTIQNPCINLLTMTTPETLFNSLDMLSLIDGFVNRFLISISDAQRSVRKKKPYLEVPESIISWADRVTKRYGKTHTPQEKADAIIIEFTDEANELQEKFAQEMVDKANELDSFGLGELPSRCNEISMRMALIYALSRDPDTDAIESGDVKWCTQYVKRCFMQTYKKLRMSISHSDFEQEKKNLLADLRGRKDGIKFSEMLKTPPYSKHKRKELEELLGSLEEAELIFSEPFTKGKGRPTMLWRAI